MDRAGFHSALAWADLRLGDGEHGIRFVEVALLTIVLTAFSVPRLSSFGLGCPTRWLAGSAACHGPLQQPDLRFCRSRFCCRKLFYCFIAASWSAR